MTSNDEWTLLYRAPDSTEAHMLKQRLETGGIPARLAGGAGFLAFGELPMDALHIDIWVPTAALGPARERIEGYYAERHSDRDETETAWTCSDCGEENPEGFRICWSCGSAAAAD